MTKYICYYGYQSQIVSLHVRTMLSNCVGVFFCAFISSLFFVFAFYSFSLPNWSRSFSACCYWPGKCAHSQADLCKMNLSGSKIIKKTHISTPVYAKLCLFFQTFHKSFFIVIYPKGLKLFKWYSCMISALNAQATRVPHTPFLTFKNASKNNKSSRKCDKKSYYPPTTFVLFF